MALESLFDKQVKSGELRVLTVCTGNICRSPLAEMLLNMVLSDLPVLVTSAGTQALVGRGMPVENQEIAKGLGVNDPTNHQARLLTAAQIAESDLVLALSREHRRAIVELVPRASRYTFTLREFARLAEAFSADDLDRCESTDAAERMREVVELVAQLRGSVPISDPTQDDVIDPYKHEFDVYEQQAEQLVPAVNATAKLLRAATIGISDGGAHGG